MELYEALIRTWQVLDGRLPGEEGQEKGSREGTRETLGEEDGRRTRGDQRDENRQWDRNGREGMNDSRTEAVVQLTLNRCTRDYLSRTRKC